MIVYSTRATDDLLLSWLDRRSNMPTVLSRQHWELIPLPDYARYRLYADGVDWTELRRAGDGRWHWDGGVNGYPTAEDAAAGYLSLLGYGWETTRPPDAMRVVRQGAAATAEDVGWLPNHPRYVVAAIQAGESVGALDALGNTVVVWPLQLLVTRQTNAAGEVRIERVVRVRLSAPAGS